MKVGDLVKVIYDTPKPTTAYSRMLQTGAPGVVAELYHTPHGQVCVKIFYDGENLLTMLENLEIVNENR